MSDVFKDAIANLLAPIGDLLADKGVSEIMINGPFDIFVKRKVNVYAFPINSQMTKHSWHLCVPLLNP